MALPVIQRLHTHVTAGCSDDGLLLVAPVHVLCRRCGTPLSLPCFMRSRLFVGRTGPAALYDRVLNTAPSRAGPERRVLTTGEHVVRDEHCSVCRAYVGWAYISAEAPSERYKEGKWCLEGKAVRCRDMLTLTDLPAERAQPTRSPNVLYVRASDVSAQVASRSPPEDSANGHSDLLARTVVFVDPDNVPSLALLL